MDSVEGELVDMDLSLTAKHEQRREIHTGK